MVSSLYDEIDVRDREFYASRKNIRIGIFGPFSPPYDRELTNLQLTLKKNHFENTCISTDLQSEVERLPEYQENRNHDIQNMVASIHLIKTSDIHIISLFSEKSDDPPHMNDSVIGELSLLNCNLLTGEILKENIIYLVHKDLLKSKSGSLGTVIKGMIHKSPIENEVFSELKDTYEHVIEFCEDCVDKMLYNESLNKKSS